MKKQNFAKLKNALKGKGFIFALVLCVAAVGVATYIAYDGAVSRLGITEGTEAATDGFQEEALGAGGNQTGIPKDEAPVSTTESTEAANNFFDAKAPRVMPVKDSTIINGYSNGELVKSETLGTWQTHDGIDLAAPLGTIVQSCTTGTVTEIYEDAQWGICVVIDHKDGNVGYYFGLDKSVDVTVGQEMLSGEAIGKVGNTAEIECLLEPHLHFAVKSDGEFVNPEEYIAG